MITSGRITDITLPYTQRVIKFTPNKGWLFPLFAALRGAMDEETSTWLVDPFQLFKDIGAELFIDIEASFQENDRTSTRPVGRSSCTKDS